MRQNITVCPKPKSDKWITDVRSAAAPSDPLKYDVGLCDAPAIHALQVNNGVIEWTGISARCV